MTRGLLARILVEQVRDPEVRLPACGDEQGRDPRTGSRPAFGLRRG